MSAAVEASIPNARRAPLSLQKRATAVIPPGLRSVTKQLRPGVDIHVPSRARLVRVVARSDGLEVPIYSTAHYERVATKQASKKEVRKARCILDTDPLART